MHTDGRKAGLSTNLHQSHELPIPDRSARFLLAILPRGPKLSGMSAQQAGSNLPELSPDIEVWREIVGTNGRYEASNWARVRATFHPLAGRPRGGEYEDDVPGLLKDYVGPRGYRCVILDTGEESKAWGRHRCLLAAFVGPPPTPEHRATFLNGKHADLRFENIAWCTPKECIDLKRLRGVNSERPRRAIGGQLHFRCTCCDKWLPSGDFYRFLGGLSRLGNRLSRCRLTSECRQCSNIRRSERRRIAIANGGRSPSRLEKIAPLLAKLDAMEPEGAEVLDFSPAQTVRRARKRIGLTMSELARLAGLHQQTIEEIEKGKNIPQPRTMAKLLTALVPADAGMSRPCDHAASGALPVARVNR